MSKEERVADLRLKAQAKRHQRMKKKMVILELLRLSKTDIQGRSDMSVLESGRTASSLNDTY